MTTVKGLVLKEKYLGDNDKFLTILTDSMGLIEVIAKGVRKQNSKNAATAQIFSYANFSIATTQKGNYILNSSEPIRLFYDLRNNLSNYALAIYMCEVMMFVSTENESNFQALRLILNCFHFLEKNKIPHNIIKPIFEMRLMSELGMTPYLVGCCECFKYTAEHMEFDLKNGKLYCTECAPGNISSRCAGLDEVLLDALRYISLVDMEKLFKFRIDEDYIFALNDITESYMRVHLNTEFKSLDFYRQINEVNII